MEQVPQDSDGTKKYEVEHQRVVLTGIVIKRLCSDSVHKGTSTVECEEEEPLS